jgi:hypothetical protein
MLQTLLLIHPLATTMSGLPDGRPRAPVIALTGTELFAGWEIEHAWKDMGDPHAKFVRHPIVRIENLWTLADITQQLYLGLPDPRLESDHFLYGKELSDVPKDRIRLPLY